MPVKPNYADTSGPSEITEKKIAIRGDGKSPDQKVIDMQLQAANLVYIFDVIILNTKWEMNITLW